MTGDGLTLKLTQMILLCEGRHGDHKPKGFGLHCAKYNRWSMDTSAIKTPVTRSGRGLFTKYHSKHLKLAPCLEGITRVSMHTHGEGSGLDPVSVQTTPYSQVQSAVVQDRSPSSHLPGA